MHRYRVALCEVASSRSPSSCERERETMVKRLWSSGPMGDALHVRRGMRADLCMLMCADGGGARLQSMTPVHDLTLASVTIVAPDSHVHCSRRARGGRSRGGCRCRRPPLLPPLPSCDVPQSPLS